MAIINQFQAYDIVKVISNAPKLSPVYGSRGIVRGISQSETDPRLFYYAVDFISLKKNYFIAEKDLRAIGQAVKPSVVETDCILRVSKQGQIVDNGDS